MINNCIDISEHSLKYYFCYSSYLRMPCLAYCEKTTKQLNDTSEMCIFQIQIKLGLSPRATEKQTSISVEYCVVHICTRLLTVPINVNKLDNFSPIHFKNSDLVLIGILHNLIS